ncbi:helix-turn-helix transcriptional regulator [Thalassobius sp. I31.1]|uniref:helix-turn-helix domain-containing protein n=1 Tax=Thalassobius sp. I31.1 TaxID=2109912 RepID=UPI0013008350|nr:helix-turn-helix transcriptional regulator [Thalassobius sp. I31.1]
MDWRERLKLLIQNRGYKITEFSEKCGLNRDYVSRITNNPKSNPKIDSLQACCDELGISLGQLFTGDNLSDTREEAISIISKMGQKEVAALTKTLKSDDWKDEN